MVDIIKKGWLILFTGLTRGYHHPSWEFWILCKSEEWNATGFSRQVNRHGLGIGRPCIIIVSWRSAGGAGVGVVAVADPLWGGLLGGAVVRASAGNGSDEKSSCPKIWPSDTLWYFGYALVIPDLSSAKISSRPSPIRAILFHSCGAQIDLDVGNETQGDQLTVTHPLTLIHRTKSATWGTAQYKLERPNGPNFEREKGYRYL
jgi:hypothetical protein